MQTGPQLLWLATQVIEPPAKKWLEQKQKYLTTEMEGGLFLVQSSGEILSRVNSSIWANEVSRFSLLTSSNWARLHRKKLIHFLT